MIRLPIAAVPIFAVIAFGQSAVPADVDGWSNAKWGMTENQIMDAFGTAVPTADGLGNFIIPDYQIGKGRFEITLLTDGDTKLLSGVVIVPVDEVGGYHGLVVSQSRENLFDDLKTLLISTYGQPTSSGGNNNLAAWHFKSTTIQLVLATYSTGTFLTLDYRQVVKGVLSTF